MNTNEEIKMGWVLKTYFIITLVINGLAFLGVFLYYTANIDRNKYGVDTLALFYGITVMILITAAIIMIFKWKKAGVYLFGIVSLVDFLVNLILDGPVSIGEFIGQIIGLILTILAFIYSLKLIEKKNKSLEENKEY